MTTIGIQGYAVPTLGFGTWRLTGREAERAVATALDVGYRHLDTAEIYENEAEVGRALHASGVDREAVFLTTKVWHDHLRRTDLLRATEASLRRLGTDYVDLLLVHWPTDAVPLKETLDALQEVRAQGSARLIGVSNFPPTLLERALDHVPDLACIQVEYHPFLGQATLLELARKHGMMLTAYSPIARGEVMNDGTLQTLAAAHGKTPSQVALRWLLQQDHVAAIPRSSNPEHIAANFDVFDFALSEDEMDRIAALPKDRRLVSPDFAPDWEH